MKYTDKGIEYEKGDMVTCIEPTEGNEGSGWQLDHTFVVTSINIHSTGEQVLFGGIGTNGVYTNALRPATLEEISRKNVAPVLQFGEHTSQFTNKERVKFGCKKYTKEQIAQIFNLMYEGLIDQFIIYGHTITFEQVEKVYEYMFSPAKE